MEYSKENQIEEMAKIMCNCYDSGNCKMHGNLCDLKCISGFNALGLYNAGYRKASDVAREIFEEIEASAKVKYWRGGGLVVFEVDGEDFAELKKKYTEGGE